jgi:hypothetical protein
LIYTFKLNFKNRADMPTAYAALKVLGVHCQEANNGTKKGNTFNEGRQNDSRSSDIV